MVYEVELTPRATADVDEAVSYLRQFAPEAARRWLDGLMAAVLSLEEMPLRCAFAPETEALGVELRQLIYGQRAGTYRIIFRVYEGSPRPIVRVLAVRHSARQRLTPEEFAEHADW